MSGFTGDWDGRRPAVHARPPETEEDDGMSDLVAFIEARLDEDEAAAKRLAVSLERQNMGGTWSSSKPPSPGTSVTINTAWTSDRVLREVEAKRAILAEHRHAPMNGCRVCAEGVRTVNGKYIVNPADWPCPTVRALAAVWSEHPDYPA